MLFDAYRPNAVQAFMVEREFRLQAEAANMDPASLTEENMDMLSKKVFRIWGEPSDNPATPPPHSTGAAVDITLADETGKEVFMGSPIDENSDRSNPDYFLTASDDNGKRAHANRTILYEIMFPEGFERHETEWWHFSMGDQYWTWKHRQKDANSQMTACYGRADRVM